MTDKSKIPEPASHGRTVSVKNVELAPGAHLSRESKGPMGESHYFSFRVLDVDPSTEELELYSLSNRERRTISVEDLAAALGEDTFVVSTGLDEAEGQVDPEREREP